MAVVTPAKKATTTPTKEQTEANVKKTLAEVELALATAEDKRASAKKNELEAFNAKLDAEHTKLLIEHSKIENEVARIALAKCQREESFSSVSDLYHHVYNFDDAVSERSVKQCIQTLTAWSRQAPGCEILIYINSPGGSIVEGFALIDFIHQLRAQGHEVTIVALGMAASMAGAILQAATRRVMGANAMLLIHEGSLGAIGNYGEIEDTMNLMSIFHERLLALFEQRAVPINPKTTKAFIRKQWKRKDWWLPSDEALKLGFVDEVR